MNMQLAADLGHRGLPSDNATASLAGDLIWGVKDVAAFIGQTERQAFYLVATGQIPIGKVGGRIVASRAALRARFASLVSGAAQKRWSLQNG
jgi:hypothetical protein